MLSTKQKETIELIQNEIWYLKLKLDFLTETIMYSFTPDRVQEFKESLKDLTSKIILSEAQVNLSYFQNGILVEKYYE